MARFPLHLLAALVVLALAPACGLAAQRFLSTLEDVPLMAGLAEVAGRGVSYDKPEGRIVEAYATGPVSAHEVRAYYAESLAQLGWRAVAPDTFRRDDEILVLTLEKAAAGLGVRFTLAPGR